MDIQKVMFAARKERMSNISRGFTNILEVDEESLSKAQNTEEEENPFEKAIESEFDNSAENPFVKAANGEMEKSDIMEAVRYSQDIRISKTGKEIKDQINDVVMPYLNAKLETAKSNADNALEDCGNAPTKEVDKWWLARTDIDCGYKIYDWNETYTKPNNPGCPDCEESYSAEDAEGKKINYAETKEQSKARVKYNNYVREICDVLVDIKTCDILKTLKENKEYQLSPDQILALKF